MCNTYWKQCEDVRHTIEGIDDCLPRNMYHQTQRWNVRYEQDKTSIPLTTRNNEANSSTQANKDNTITLTRSVLWYGRRRGHCRRLQKKCLMHLREESSGKSMDLCWFMDSCQIKFINYTRRRWHTHQEQNLGHEKTKKNANNINIILS